jgi:sugar O-acyltransferase (sialic acid O-acetyltransferase NeuD family)
MKNKVVIFGVGDFARVASVYLTKDSPYEIVAFTAHKRYIQESELLNHKVVPFERLEDLYPPDQYAMFVAVGFSRVNKARAELYHLCKSKGYELISYINSKATYWSDIEVGDNCFIFENNVIQPFVKIGNDVTIWSGNHIGHDASIGDHCFIASHAVISGNVNIGPYCFIGVNATISDKVIVAPECFIGAGAIILRNTKERGVYIAQPTKLSPVTSSELEGLRSQEVDTKGDDFGST